MTISPKTYETVGQSLGLAAHELTLQVGDSLTDVYRQIIHNPDAIHRASQTYNWQINKALTEWNEKWKDWADQDLATAYLRGVNHADSELRQLGSRRLPDGTISDQTPLAGKGYTLLPPQNIPPNLAGMFATVPNHLTFYNVFRRAAYHNLEGATLQVLRATKDLYRDAAVQAGSKMFRETDIFTRRKFSQAMLDDFARQGIKTVTYANGRRVSIEAYSEMVGRTTSGHAAVQAQLNRCEEYGYDLIRITAHFRACPLCEPYEGAVLSISGQSSHYQSLDDAVAQGLFHPNCFVDKQVKIFTSQGWRALGDIQVGDLVLTHLGRFRKVTKLHRNQGRPKLAKVKVAGPSFGAAKGKTVVLTVTEGHPLLVDGEWVPAEKVRPGAKIRMLAASCIVCGKPSFLHRTTCSVECSVKNVVEKRDSPEYRKKLSQTSRRAILSQLAAGLIDTKQRTQAANRRTREMVREGIHPLQKHENHRKANRVLGQSNYGGGRIEQIMEAYLTKELGLEIIPQFRIPKDFDALERQRYYFVDFLISGSNLVIECDGEYWHDEGEDQARQTHIEKQGYMVLRFTDEQITNNIEACGKEVQRVLANHNDEYLFMDMEIAEVKVQEPKRTYPLYNLSVEEDESYVAKGFVVHNCAHGTNPYFPGLSPKQEVRVDPGEQKLIDEHGYKKAQELSYKAQQKQRYIERNIRQWKTREITALDPAAKAKAHRKVLDWRQAQRTHLKKNPYLPRKYEREAVRGYKQASTAWRQQAATAQRPATGVPSPFSDSTRRSLEVRFLEENQKLKALQQRTLTLTGMPADPEKFAAEMKRRMDAVHAQRAVVNNLDGQLANLPTPTPRLDGWGNSTRMKAWIADVDIPYRQVVDQGDAFLAELARLRGFDQLPKHLTKAQADLMVRQGQGFELFRGVHQTAQAQQFKTGAYYAGQGIHGNGTYTAFGVDAAGVAQSFAGQKGAVIRMVLPKNANIMEYTTLSKMRQIERTRLEGLLKSAVKKAEETGIWTEANRLNALHQMTTDIGRFGTSIGVDAFYVDGVDYMIVLNRSIVGVVK